MDVKTKTEPLTPQRRLKAYIYSHGMRATSERDAILEAALSFNGGFVPTEILERLRQKGLEVTPPTVYSCLRLFCDAGILRRGIGLDGRNCYITFDNDKPKVALVCTRCGKTRHVNVAGIDSAILRNKFWGFSPASYQLRVDGLCSRCQKEAKAEASSLPKE